MNSDCKYLLLLRHAEAKEFVSGERDCDRFLTPYGCRSASELGRASIMKVPIPQLIITSTAIRALQTAKLWAKAAEVSVSHLVICEKIYQATCDSLLNLVSSLDEKIKTVLIVGHNPAISELVSYISNQSISVQTCTIAIISIRKRWINTMASSSVLLSIERPVFD